ncbi:Galactinol synthase 1 [Sesamum angolense]|uniref:Hexosyltransferase n=1 Tax=Sesamum angolense TaxID=2727404 RepID=A0AAE2BYT4_9LAMI|nr:Galactinol synthase 1 [Sesamum angolense]
MAPVVPVEVFPTAGKIPALVPKKAYVTFLAGNGDYVKGVVGLAKGLRKVKSAYPLVVAILPDVPEDHRELLRTQGCIVKEIEPIYPPENQIQFAMAYYVINYSKLRIWNFEEYSKMVYLDADIQVYENIDHLLDMPDGHFYAVMDCFCEKTWSHSPQYSIAYCQQCPNKVTWPAEMGSPPPLYFNAGMFVFEPSKATYENLLETLRITPPTPFAEQDFLNMFFEPIYKPIPLVGSKPWRYTGKEANMEREDIKMLVEKWWEVYNDETLDFKPEDSIAGEEAFSRPSIMASMPEPAVSYIPAPSAA